MDKALDGLLHKRISRVLSGAILLRSGSLVELLDLVKYFVTLVYQSLASLKKGSCKEVSLATQPIALCAITLGPGDNTHEIYEDSLPPLSRALESDSESSKILSVLDCLAIVTFIGANHFEETEKSMQIIWKLIQRVASNVNARKHSPAILAAAISAWSFILTTVGRWRLNYKYCQGAISYLSDLIENDEESVHIAALEALTIIFEARCFNSFSIEAKSSRNCLIHEGKTSTNVYSSIQEMKDNILHRVRRLSLKDEIFKDCKNDWLKVFEIKFMKRILGSGFNKHMQENEFLHKLLKFHTPKREDVSGHGCEPYELDGKEVIAEYYEPKLKRQNKSCIQKRRNGHYVVDDEC